MVLATCGLLIGTTAMMTSCDDEVLTGQPSWLGNSIYERLQEDGHYSTVLRLIDDDPDNMKEVLGHTGSKTLFVADDDAYEAWFQNNSWGVRRYEDLTTAQRKLLLKNAMINNAYLIELMSNVSGTPPKEGMAMRRETASTIYDSVYVMSAAEMPTTSVWAPFKSRGKSIPIFKDNTAAPMIHFLPAYMTSKSITDEDLNILTNGQATSANEAWVNGMKVVERDITCKNGYIQKVSGVIESNPNMAEILRQHPEMSMWSHLVDRYSAPYFDANLNREYNRIYNTKDSVYTLRYFSTRSSDSPRNSNTAFDRLPSETTGHATLSFDPGWNHYMYSNTEDKDLHYDAGAMIVPTNEALETWWNSQGRDLQDEYKEWDSIPEATLAKLINVNMLDNFSDKVPSKFSSVLNDAKEKLGITKEDVIACYMGCNGVVYLVNKVFTPAEYSSVAYPALAHESTMNTIYWAIDHLTFLPYLLSMDSKYVLLLPNNDAMLRFIDPANSDIVDPTTGMEAPQMLEFKYDPKKSKSEKVQASRYNTICDADGNIEREATPAQAQVGRKVIDQLLSDMLNQMIIVIADKSMELEDYVRQGYTFFKTKGGNLLKVTEQNGQMAFMGGWQMEHNNRQLVSAASFPKTNGTAYLLTEQMPLSTQKSLYMTLKEHEEYLPFYQIMDNAYCDLFIEHLNNQAKYNTAFSRQANKNMRLFDNYNYTVFVPKAEAINKLVADGYLPQQHELQKVSEDGTIVLDSICKAENWYDLVPNNEKAQDTVRIYAGECLQNIVTDFVRYHIMDRSVAIGMAPEANFNGTVYESMKRNPATGRFFPINVTYDTKSMTVTDNTGKAHQVVTNAGDDLYNNLCREYWFEGSGNSAQIFNTSSAVVHLINEPLYYEPMQKWRDVVKAYIEKKLKK